MIAYICNTDDVIDSRDLVEYMNMYETELRVSGDWEYFDSFREEFETEAVDFVHGACAISDDYFTEYVKEMIRDCGYIPANLPGFIKDNIDWEGVADRVREDYTELSFGGSVYWSQ